MRWSIALVAIAVGSAHADDKVKRAQELFVEGRRHFDIGDYAPAIASWKESYLLSNAPLLLFNIGQAYRLSGNCAQANRFYLNYKRVEPRPKNQVELDLAMEKCKGVEPATSDPEPTEPTPPAAPPEPVTAQPPPPSPPSPPPEPPRHTDGGGMTGLQLGGILTGAAGAVALGYATLLVVQANSDANKVANAPFGTPWSTVDRYDRDGKSKARTAKLVGAAGGVAAIAGATMWWLGRRSARVDVAVTPSHAEVVCAFAF